LTLRRWRRKPQKPISAPPAAMPASAMKASASSGATWWSTSGIATPAAATPPSTKAPSPPITIRPSCAGRATQSAVSSSGEAATSVFCQENQVPKPPSQIR
jgi:hypothetical protein